MKNEFINSIEAVGELAWQNLTNDSSPFTHYKFHEALEKSQSVCTKSGWQPHHLLCSEYNSANTTEIKAIIPMYLKQHSWGEYVFDWAWADAYDQHNVPYYPKLVATVPFTPITSDKIISNSCEQLDLFPILIEHCQKQQINSWHILFTQKTPIPALLQHHVFERNTVQFHWFNKQYNDFDEFLSTFTARKRKNVKKERITISEQNIKIRQVRGKDVTEQELAFFYLGYQLTYLKRGHTPHLTADFFAKALSSLPDNILLIIASLDGEDVACAWFFFDEYQLYGRHWGCTKSLNNLHFELCYYQGIEFCITHKINVFNPGAQGEHKLQRGFIPVLTYSYHWIKHQGFQPAIKEFCKQEQRQMQTYLTHCQTLLPFKTMTE